MESPVTACGAECAVLRMERYGVDGVDISVVDAAGSGGAVAFEGEICAAIFFLDVLDRASTFYASDGEAAPVVEAGHDSSLPFQWRLDGFVKFSRVAEIYDVDIAVCGCNDKEGIHDIETVDTFLACD